MMNELDKISQLPGHITDNILSRLPIKEAVRTSILSRTWRYKWCSIPELVFDDQCTSDTSMAENLWKIIDKVLLLHTGPLQKFKLSHKGIYASNDIDACILHLSSVSVKEIVIDIWRGQQYYKIPASLFDCQDLTHLELFQCLVEIPLTFEGFKDLQSLDLQYVELSSDELEALISHCPLLKRLTLKNIEGIWRINFKAGNLEWLDVEGAFQEVTFDVMNNLKSVKIGFSVYNANEHGPNNANSGSLHKFFRNLPNIQTLMLKNDSLKYLAIGNVPRTPPDELVHLKCLYTCIDFKNLEEIMTVMCLMRSSP